jgi:cytochrome P450
VAHELLSKRSGNYSDRPFIPALEHDNRDSGQYLPLMSKNDKWSRQRKFAKQIMDTSAKEEFYGYPELESIRLLFEVMTEPSRYNHALESFVARVTCRLGWGTPIAAEELKQRARELLIGVSPTGSFANKLPFIMSLPESWTKSKAWELRRGRTERKFFETMQADVRQQIKDSEKHPDAPSLALPGLQPKNSWMRMFLENKKAWKFDSDLEGAYAVGMHGIAGALTVAAPMQSFCLALCHYPQHQQILHEEIDRVLGDRMIRFSDMPDMPILRAFIRETLRWRPPVPTGKPYSVDLSMYVYSPSSRHSACFCERRHLRRLPHTRRIRNASARMVHLS